MDLAGYKKILLIAIYGVLVIGFIFVENKQRIKNGTFPNRELLSSVIDSITATPKNVALTFDDGPYGTSTSKILDILKQENIHATFFVIGKNVEKFPDLARRMVTEGNLIENHSYDHAKNLPDLLTSTFQTNIQQAELAIASTTGLKSKLFRPPYGNISIQMYEELRNNGHKTVLWTIEAKDWDSETVSTDMIEKIIVQGTKPNGIILLHDGHDTIVNYPRENMVNALPYIIDQLKKQGYTFVTLDKIVDIAPYF